jgi:hypothetical protein
MVGRKIERRGKLTTTTFSMRLVRRGWLWQAIFALSSQGEQPAQPKE